MQTDRSSQPTRVLVMADQPLIAEVIALTLNHGIYATRQAKDLAEASAALTEWLPQLAVVDMDIGGDKLVRQMGLSADVGGTRIPTLALTRRGDLKTKLAAF